MTLNALRSLLELDLQDKNLPWDSKTRILNRILDSEAKYLLIEASKHTEMEIYRLVNSIMDLIDNHETELE